MHPREHEPWPKHWRTVVSSILVVLGCVALLPSVVALWLSSVVTDTDRYVSTVGPLVDEPAIQRAVSDRVSDGLLEHIDAAGIVERAAAELSAQELAPRAASALGGLAEPIAGGVEGWVQDHVDALVTSDRFADLWTEANRLAHDRVLAVVTGEDDDRALAARGDTISLDLSPLVANARERLVAAGFDAADRIPNVDVELVLFQSDGVAAASRGLDAVDRLGGWLPLLAVGLVAAGVAVAADHRRALVAAGLGVVATMVVLGLALAIVRTFYLEALPATVRHDVAAVTFDQVLTYLRTTLRTVLVVGLVVALVAYLAGPSSQAVAIRRGSARLGSRARGRGWSRTRAVVWLNSHKRPVQALVAIVAVVTFVFWDHPTAGVVAGIAFLGGLVVVLTELLTAPPA